jgi:muramoyltetrapeptide carboxypeptidase
MFADKEVKGIWCLRGGYGCTRIIPYLDYKLIRKNPKIFIGYSDVTALLLAFEREAGLMGIHGAVASSSIFSDYTFNVNQQMLFEMKGNYTYKVKPQSDKDHTDIYIINKGIAQGKLVGGNLSLLTSLIGTKYEPIYKNKIVFIEEVGEKPYKVDRMITQLLNGTDIKKAAGIIFGVFADCEAKPDESSFTLKETLINAFSQMNIPSMYGFPFGHVTDITSLPIGAEAVFSTESQELKIQL